MCAEVGIPEDETIEKLMTKFTLTQSEGMHYMNQYWSTNKS